MTQKLTSQGPVLDTETKPKLSDAHKQLAVFVGTWAVVGENASNSPAEDGEAVTGRDVYEWLEGGFFLVYSWERNFGSGRHVGTGHIGHDPEKNAYTLHCADNLGYARTYALSGRGRSWRITGEHELATFEFSADHNTMHVKWEHTVDGSEWRPLCDLRLTRTPLS